MTYLRLDSKDIFANMGRAVVEAGRLADKDEGNAEIDTWSWMGLNGEVAALHFEFWNFDYLRFALPVVLAHVKNLAKGDDTGHVREDDEQDVAETLRALSRHDSLGIWMMDLFCAYEENVSLLERDEQRAEMVGGYVYVAGLKGALAAGRALRKFEDVDPDLEVFASGISVHYQRSWTREIINPYEMVRDLWTMWRRLATVSV